MTDTIAVLDFGGQYAHLIANRIRRLGVFTRIFSPCTPVEQIGAVKGIIFSGGPMSVYAKEAPEFNKAILDIAVPKLGICYGHQLIAQSLGGEVSPGKVNEYGISDLQTTVGATPRGCPPYGDLPNLFKNIPPKSRAWMSHGDQVSKLPPGFRAIASTDDCEIAAVENAEKKIYGIQFHPEVKHTEYGDALLENFALDICKCEKNWSLKSYLPQVSKIITEKVGNKKVFLLVSGGVDSTVVFVLLNKVLGRERVLGLHVDHGLMRYEESTQIMNFMQIVVGAGSACPNNLQICNASEEFLAALQGVTEPEQKRKIIGETFLKVASREMQRMQLSTDEWMLAQGTIYPDTIESGGTKNADLIKTHHNRVQGVLDLQEKGMLLEPLEDLYKDEVRILGEELGIPKELVWRHPFPGPGLGVRLLCSDGKPAEKTLGKIPNLKIKAQVLPIKSVGVQGDSRTYAQPLLIEEDIPWEDLEKHSTSLVNRFKEINRCVWLVSSCESNTSFEVVPQYCAKESLDALRLFDNICSNFLHEHNLYNEIWQMPIVLLPLKIANKPCIVMRPINSSEAMTANFAKIDQNLLRTSLWPKLKEAGLGALLYDVTHKPPATIEWE